MPRAELGIDGLKSWGRDWQRKVEKRKKKVVREGPSQTMASPQAVSAFRVQPS
ncbi:MAG: hypothetical protein ABSH35_01935 [Isosphaeraceae bacterium]|jgi:hypothetical protein